MKKKNLNYMQVVPDSQFFANLGMILAYCSYRHPKDRYLLVALENTIKKYKLVKISEK
jgi:hypothetical protein